MMNEAEERTSESSLGTITVLERVHDASREIEQVSKSEFSCGVELKRARITVLLHPLAQLHTSPEPQKIVTHLKTYLARCAEGEGIEVEESEVDEALNPVLKEFLDEIFEVAEKTRVEPPESYKTLYKEL